MKEQISNSLVEIIYWVFKINGLMCSGNLGLLMIGAYHLWNLTAANLGKTAATAYDTTLSDQYIVENFCFALKSLQKQDCIGYIHFFQGDFGLKSCNSEYRIY
jgi:hypothetical protein